MPLDTHAELLSAVADWLARNDIEPGRAGDFVRLFEAQADRVLRTRDAERIETLPLTPGEAGLALPADVRSVRAVRLEGGPVLQPLPMAAMALPQAAPAGTPRFWSVAGWTLHVAPVPAAGGTVEIRYLGGLCRLSAARPTNWLLRRHPDAYLYGALWQAALYVADDAAAQGYKALADAALAMVQTAEGEALGTGATAGAGPLVARVG